MAPRTKRPCAGAGEAASAQRPITAFFGVSGGGAGRLAMTKPAPKTVTAMAMRGASTAAAETTAMMTSAASAAADADYRDDPGTTGRFAGGRRGPGNDDVDDQALPPSSFESTSTAASSYSAGRPELPPHVQAGLLSVGMRVRSAVRQGYKTKPVGAPCAAVPPPPPTAAGVGPRKRPRAVSAADDD